jgi:hypothetical protein
MSRPGIGGDHQSGFRHEGYKSPKGEPTGKNGSLREAGPCSHGKRACPFTSASRDYDTVPGLRQPIRHLREPAFWPEPAGKGCTHMDDRGVWPLCGNGRWFQPDVVGIRCDSMPLEQAGPAPTLVQFLDPVRTIAIIRGMRDYLPGTEGLNQQLTLRSAAVQVHRDIDSALFHCQRL